MEIKNCNIYATIISSESYENFKSPSVDFKKNEQLYLEDLRYEFSSLSESQNGLYEITHLPDGTYKAEFFTTDDCDDWEQRKTGEVTFSIQVLFETNIEHFLEGKIC